MAEGIKTTNTISHYAAGGSSTSWTANEATGAWTRQITGIGGLVASQEDGHEAVLQLSDLQGNIIGTASLSATATKLLTTERTTEFGVPTSSKPLDKYNWLGAAGITTALANGTIAQDGITYTPQIGQPLQTQGVAPPLPENKAIPYIGTIAPWIAAGAAADAAHQTTLWEEAQAKVAAATPEGEVLWQGEAVDPKWWGIEFYQELYARAAGIEKLCGETAVLAGIIEFIPKAGFFATVTVASYEGYLKVLAAGLRVEAGILRHEHEREKLSGADWIEEDYYHVKVNLEILGLGYIERNLPEEITSMRCGFDEMDFWGDKTSFRCGGIVRWRKGIHT